MKNVPMRETEILRVAAEREFFVAKYGTAHEKLRKKTRRMLKEGFLELVRATNQGFFYRASPKTMAAMLAAVGTENPAGAVPTTHTNKSSLDELI